MSTKKLEEDDEFSVIGNSILKFPENIRLARSGKNCLGETRLYSGFARYLWELRCIPLISKDEYPRLIAMVQSGNREAYERLISGNLRFVVFIAKKYRNLGLSANDLVSYGNIGLIKAADKVVNGDYDPAVSNFCTYSAFSIRRSILRAIDQKVQLIKIPIHTLQFKRKMDLASRDLSLELHREPTDEEIADYMKVNVNKVLSVRARIPHVVWLDAPISNSHDADGDGENLHNFHPDDLAIKPDGETLLRNEAKVLLSCLDRLTERQRVVLQYRSGIVGGRTHSLEEIGKILRVSRERVRQIEIKAIERLKHLYQSVSDLDEVLRLIKSA
jgi:RNA polymerase primary sigma factor